MLSIRISLCSLCMYIKTILLHLNLNHVRRQKEIFAHHKMDNPDDNNIWKCSCLIASSDYCLCSRLYAKVRIGWNISESIRSENIFRLRFHFGFHKCRVKLGRNSTKPSMVFRSAFMNWRTRTNWNANISIIYI